MYFSTDFAKLSNQNVQQPTTVKECSYLQDCTEFPHASKMRSGNTKLPFGLVRPLKLSTPTDPTMFESYWTMTAKCQRLELKISLSYGISNIPGSLRKCNQTKAFLLWNPT